MTEYPDFYPTGLIAEFYGCKTLGLPSKVTAVFGYRGSRPGVTGARLELLQLENGQHALFLWTPDATASKVLGLFDTFDEARAALLLVDSTRGPYD